MSSIVVSLEECKVSSVRADMLKGVVKITFEARLDDQMSDARRELAILAFDESPVDLEIRECIPRLLTGSGKLGG